MSKLRQPYTDRIKSLLSRGETAGPKWMRKTAKAASKYHGSASPGFKKTWKTIRVANLVSLGLLAVFAIFIFGVLFSGGNGNTGGSQSPSAPSPNHGQTTTQTPTPAPIIKAPVVQTGDLNPNTPEGRIAISDRVLEQSILDHGSQLKANASEKDILNWVGDVIRVNCTKEYPLDFNTIAPNILAQPFPGQPAYELMKECNSATSSPNRPAYQPNDNPDQSLTRTYNWPAIHADKAAQATVHLEWKYNHWLITSVIFH